MASSLERLELALAAKLALGLDRGEARVLSAWLLGEADWVDLDDSTVDMVQKRFYADKIDLDDPYLSVSKLSAIMKEVKEECLSFLHDFVEGTASRAPRDVYEGASLDLVPFIIFFKREFGVTKEQAHELIAWMRLDKDWRDLSHDARGPIISRWDPDSAEVHPGMSYDDWAMDEISKLARDKYDLDTRELIG